MRENQLFDELFLYQIVFKHSSTSITGLRLQGFETNKVVAAEMERSDKTAHQTGCVDIFPKTNRLTGHLIRENFDMKIHIDEYNLLNFFEKFKLDFH